MLKFFCFIFDAYDSDMIFFLEQDRNQGFPKDYNVKCV